MCKLPCKAAMSGRRAVVLAVQPCQPWPPPGALSSISYNTVGARRQAMIADQLGGVLRALPGDHMTGWRTPVFAREFESGRSVLTVWIAEYIGRKSLNHQMFRVSRPEQTPRSRTLRSPLRRRSERTDKDASSAVVVFVYQASRCSSQLQYRMLARRDSRQWLTKSDGLCLVEERRWPLSCLMRWCQIEISPEEIISVRQCPSKRA